MKKRLAKWVAIFLAAVMVFSMASAAFAEGDETDGTNSSDTSEDSDGTFTLSLAASTTGYTHVYAVYQIFTGTVVTKTETSTDDDGNETSTTTKTLASLAAGQNYNGTITTTDDDGNTTSVTYDVLSAAALIIDDTETAVTDSEKLEVISLFVDLSLIESKNAEATESNTPVAVIKDGGSVTLAAGYYLIVDLGIEAESTTDGASSITVPYTSSDNSESSDSTSSTAYYYTSVGDGDSYSLALAVLLTENQENITRKADVPTVDKDVLEVNDSGSDEDETTSDTESGDDTSGTEDGDSSGDNNSSGTEGDDSSDDNGSDDDADEDSEDTEDSEGTWQDTADYDIGDYISFRLTGTLPSDYAEYETYTYRFTDTLSSGLTLVYGTYGTESTYTTSSSDGNGDSLDYAIKVYVNNTSTDENGNKTTTSTALTLDTDYIVSVAVNDDGTTSLVIKLGYYETSTNDSGEETKTFIEDLTAITDSSGNALISADSEIVVEYIAQLNSGAVIGGEGNTNTVSVTYSNDPGDESGGTTSDTPDDTVTVFTYKLVIYKYAKADGGTSDVEDGGTDTEESYTTETSTDGSGNTTTTYTYADGTVTTTVTDSSGNVTSSKTTTTTVTSSTTTTNSSSSSDNGESSTTTTTTTITTINASGEVISSETYTPLSGAGFTLYKYDEDSNNYVKVGDEVESKNGSYEFSWSGLDAGKYKLVESTTPSGYLTMDDYYFEIVAEIQEDSTSSSGYSIKSLSAVDSDGTTLLTASVTTTTDEDENTSVKISGVLTGNVINESGISLPTTGAIGLVLLILAAAAVLVIAFVLRKRSGRDSKTE